MSIVGYVNGTPINSGTDAYVAQQVAAASAPKTTTSTATAPTPTKTTTSTSSYTPVAVPTYGSTITDTAGRTGTALYDPNTGKPLAAPAPAPGTQLGVVGSAVDAASQLYSTTGGNQLTLDKALDFAKSDPSIIAKYADALKLDTQSFTQSLDQLRQASTTLGKDQQTQFENERKLLAEKSAAAGQAYSGFRGKAQQDLAQSESGIVQSSRAALQKDLQSLTSAFEGKYGSAATTAATSPFLDASGASNISLSGLFKPSTDGLTTISGDLAGGITGTQAGPSAALPYGGAAYKSDLFNAASTAMDTTTAPKTY